VRVASVNTMRYRGKKKRERTARYGRRADWKRAVVTLKEGSKIELA
jgi:large subunit ribosomal protein L23